MSQNLETAEDFRQEIIDTKARLAQAKGTPWEKWCKDRIEWAERMLKELEK